MWEEPSLGENVILSCPEFWTAEARANAVCEIEFFPKYPLSALATVALVRTRLDLKLARALLVAGWSPHETFVPPTGDYQ